MYNNAIFVSQCKDVPAGEHFAIVIESSYTSRGYDRGDPDYSSNYLEYRAYLKREDWEAAIKELETDKGYGRKNYKALFVRPAKIGVVVDVKVDIK